MIEIFVGAFIPLFVIIDPLGLTPIVMGMTAGMQARRVIGMVVKAGIVAAVILTLFGLFGDEVLNAFGIGLPAFRIAGGILLFITALEMLFAQRRPRQNKTAEKIEAELDTKDISVFPLGIPLIAGPGALTKIMLLTSREEHGMVEIAIALVAMLCVIAITIVVLSASRFLNRLLGETLPDVLTRVLGLVLASLAVQYVADGTLDIIRPLFAT